MVGDGRWGLTAGCEQEWHLCDFCEILACWRWVWWGVLSEFAELRITVQPVMQKARVIGPKTQCSFIDSHESSVGESVW